MIMERRTRDSPIVRLICGSCRKKIDELGVKNLWSSNADGRDVGAGRGARVRGRYGQAFTCRCGAEYRYRQAVLQGAYERAVAAGRSRIVAPTDFTDRPG